MPVRLSQVAAQQLADRLKYISGTTSLLILFALADEQIDVGQLAEMLGLSLPVISNQLKRMTFDGVVEGVRAGKSVVYHLTAAGRALCEHVRSLV